MYLLNIDGSPLILYFHYPKLNSIHDINKSLTLLHFLIYRIYTMNAIEMWMIDSVSNVFLIAFWFFNMFHFLSALVIRFYLVQKGYCRIAIFLTSFRCTFSLDFHVNARASWHQQASWLYLLNPRSFQEEQQFDVWGNLA